MSYAAAAALQAGVFGALTAAPALAGVSIVDAIPPGTTPGTFILIGPEVAVDQSDGTGAGAEHRFTISVISDAAGFLTAKTLAAAVSAAVLGGGSCSKCSHRLADHSPPPQLRTAPSPHPGLFEAGPSLHAHPDAVSP